MENLMKVTSCFILSDWCTLIAYHEDSAKYILFRDRVSDAVDLSENVCGFYHRYEESHSSCDRLCNLPSNHQCSSLTVRLKFIFADPFCTL
jgi:hypothetical protein